MYYKTKANFVFIAAGKIIHVLGFNAVYNFSLQTTKRKHDWVYV